MSWPMIYKHNFSPHKYYIWNNKDIIYKCKSFFLKHWFNNGIVLVDQLFNEDDLLYTYEEFLAHYEIPVTPRAYARVFGAISSKVCMLFRREKNRHSTLVPSYYSKLL